MVVLRLAVVAWALWTTVRLLGLERGYPLVAAMSYTPYAACAASITVIVAALLRQWSTLAVGAAAAFALVVIVIPRGLGGSGPAARGATLRVMTANVSVGRVPARSLVELVRRHRVDVLSIQELTPQLAADLHTAGIDSHLPSHVLVLGPGASGTGLYARMPLRALPDRHQTRHATVTAAASASGWQLELVAVHPVPPRSRSFVATWQRELRSLPGADQSSHLRVLAGDFNATLDHREFRRLLHTGYDDAATEAGVGLKPTWPSGRVWPPPVTIDHVLADARCRVGAVSVERLPGSDHRAVLAELALPPGPPHQREPRRPDQQT